MMALIVPRKYSYYFNQCSNKILQRLLTAPQKKNQQRTFHELTKYIKTSHVSNFRSTIKQSQALSRSCSLFVTRDKHYSLCDPLRNGSALYTIRNTGYPNIGGIRQFSTKDVLDKENRLSDSALTCRLANENGYLSWCRNSYLLTVVAIGILFHGTNQYTDLAGYVTLFTAGLNISWGSTVYIYNLFAFRKRIQMSIPILVINVAGALLNLSLFACILLVFAADCEPSSMMHRRFASFEVQQRQQDSSNDL